MRASQDLTGPDPDLPGGAYYQPDVPWIMYFDNAGDAIHGVYWHNNFGIRPSSHGCVGAPVWAAKWLYDWGYVGLPVWIHEQATDGADACHGRPPGGYPPQSPRRSR